MAEDEDEIGSEAEEAPPEIPEPRANPELLGHEAAEAALLRAFNSGRLPHAWLLTGLRGIGKATLAYRFARFLLAEGDPRTKAPVLFAAAPPATLAVASEHPAFRLVAARAHPDLMVVERGLDPKRRRQRREIVAEEARGVADFLHLTSSQGGWRVVIVDGADLMNVHAANGLLKILEEPPQRTVLLLVSDNPGRLLPTIRSRCRSLALKPLPESVIITLLQRFISDISDIDRTTLAGLAEGSIGRALELAANGGLTIYQRVINLLRTLPRLDAVALHELAEECARPSGDRFDLLAELLCGAVARLVAQGAGPGGAGPPAEAELLRRLAGGRSLDQWVEVWEKLTHLFAQADGINLDRKQVVLNAFFALEQAAR